MDKDHVIRIFWLRLPGPIRAIGSFLGNWLLAGIGTGVADEEFYHFFHPRTVVGFYFKEAILSAITALLLEGLVYYRWLRPIPRP